MTCFGIALVIGILHCPQEAPKAPASTYCQIAEPVRPSRRDTPETQAQAAREFAKWKNNCGARK